MIHRSETTTARLGRAMTVSFGSALVWKAVKRMGPVSLFMAALGATIAARGLGFLGEPAPTGGRDRIRSRRIREPWDPSPHPSALDPVPGHPSDRMIDEASDESFPASDAPAFNAQSGGDAGPGSRGSH